MRWLAIVAGTGIIFVPLVDAFETVLQPRRVTHRYRFARLFFRLTWFVWRVLALLLRPRRAREALLSSFGPLSTLGLFINWFFLLILGFAVLQYGLATELAGHVNPVFADYFYLSGTTFFTLGYGDVTPVGGLGRTLAVVESGLGFGFLAAVIGYLPVLYQSYSAREIVISLMDARGGSPTTAGEVLIRLARAKRLDDVDELLATWERWSAELLESSLSFPILCYYRSQHDNQSWLTVLTAILDTCAVLLTQVRGEDLYQTEMTFAMARHAAVDLTLVLNAPAEKESLHRITPENVTRLREKLAELGISLREPDFERLAELRATYEPFLAALARRLRFNLPPLAFEGKIIDNWQRSSIGRAPAIGELTSDDDDHF